MTASAAETLASEKAQHDVVVAALLPICVAQAAADPENGAMVSELKEIRSYQRTEVLMKSGWATMPGSAGPDRALAKACADKLAAPA